VEVKVVHLQVVEIREEVNHQLVEVPVVVREPQAVQVIQTGMRKETIPNNKVQKLGQLQP
jgi:ribosomal protein S19E (S16A)